MPPPMEANLIITCFQSFCFTAVCFLFVTGVVSIPPCCRLRRRCRRGPSLSSSALSSKEYHHRQQSVEPEQEESDQKMSNLGENSPSLARSRWGLLQQAILKKTIPEPKGNPASKRVFERYADLVSWTYEISKAVIYVHVLVHYVNTTPADGYLHHHHHPVQRLRPSNHHQNQAAAGAGVTNVLMRRSAASSTEGNRNLEGCTAIFKVQIHRRNTAFNVDIKNLKGFDKTGRICIWPSEQILCYWSLKNLSLFDGKKVIEIGGGFHCLAGLAIAKYSKAQHVVLTDGDEVNVEEVSYSIERNSLQADTCYASTLRWDNCKLKPEFESYFDIVVAADVVYENSMFHSLLETVSFVLKPEGQFILFNPTRDGMLQEFVRLVKKEPGAFSDVRLNEKYDNLVSEITADLVQTNSAYNREWHYPYQVAFKKVTPYNHHHVNNQRHGQLPFN